MPRVFITSGTSYTLPADFNPGNNTIECYGGGGSGAGGSVVVGGGGGAYAKVTNLNIAPGTNVQIQVGSGGGSPTSTDTYFNASSLANAVSNGTGVSCGAQGGTNGASGGAKGLASSSCGTVKFNGGIGQGTASANTGSGGGGGGGAGGPNGVGAAGAQGSTSGGGGGGGGANGGSQPANAGSAGTAGGNGRGGSGGGAGGTASTNGGNATAGSGGGGGGGGNASNNIFTTGGNGALDDVYSDGVHGPGGGGAGAGGKTGGSPWQGGNGGGYGAGGGAGGYGSSAPGIQTDGLIVVTYTPVAIGAPVVGGTARIIAIPTPAIIAARGLRQADSPPIKMDWWRQPIDRSQPPPGKVLFRQISIAPNDAPNPTPLIKLPFSQPQQNMLRNRPTLDQRQQLPGKKPLDFFANLLEGPDTVSTAIISTQSPINAALLEYDEVVAIVQPAPALGGADDIIRRVKLLLPKGWWNDSAPIRDAIIGGLSDVSAWCYSLIVYAKKQTRVASATDLWLDILSKDYFRFELPRRVNEPDEAFRTRIQKELIRERVTRKGMNDALTDLTGKTPYIFEPWNTGDAGAWDVGTFALDIAGGWGDTILPAQSFVNVIPPGAGIPGAPGWDCAALGWDIGGMWGDMNLISGTITDQDIYDTINKTRPTGAIVWTQLSAPQGPLPLPVTKVRTPSFAPPGMIPLVVQPGPQRYSIPVMPDNV